MAVGIAARFEEIGDRRLLGLSVSRALTPATAPLAGGRLLHLQGGAEGLVAVVGVQERRLIRIASRGTGAPGASTRPSEQAPGQGVTGTTGAVGCLVTVRGPVLLQQLADLGNGLAGHDQGGEHSQEDEQDEGPHGGEQRRQGVAHQPPQQSSGALQAADIAPEDRVAAADLDHSGQSRQQSQAAHGDPRVHRTQAVDPEHGDPQRRQERGHEDAQDTNGTRSDVVQEITCGPGDPEPLAQRQNRSEGQDEEGPAGTAVTPTGGARTGRGEGSGPWGGATSITPSAGSRRRRRCSRGATIGHDALETIGFLLSTALPRRLRRPETRHLLGAVAR